MTYVLSVLILSLDGHPLDVPVHADNAILIIGDLDADETIFTPSFAPGVLHNPVVGS